MPPIEEIVAISVFDSTELGASELLLSHIFPFEDLASPFPTGYFLTSTLTVSLVSLSQSGNFRTDAT